VLLLLVSGIAVTQTKVAPINGWYLARIEGGTAETYSAIVASPPLGAAYTNFCQAFYVKAEPGVTVTWKKNLGKRFKVPHAFELVLATNHNLETGANLSSYPAFRPRAGNSDTVYAVNGGGWFAPSSLSLGWSEYPFVFEWPILSGNIPNDSIDYLEFSFCFQGQSLDSVTWYFGSFSAGFPVDEFGNVQPTKTLPPPVLVDPNGEIPVAPVIVTWHMVAGSTAYGVQVGKDSTFLSNILFDDSLADGTNSIYLSRGLFDTDTPYYWRARTKNSEWGLWGGPLKFWMKSSGADVKEIPSGLPAEFALSQNYPNPFNPATKIRFAVPQASDVALRVVNVLGENTAILAQGRFSPGVYEADWNASGHPSGIYFYELRAGDKRFVKRMTLVK
jgi:hypothetical protein